VNSDAILGNLINLVCYFVISCLNGLLFVLQLRKKTAEVTKACEKHYALEQELAFYKIDHKFDALSRPPNLPTPDASLVSVASADLLSTHFIYSVASVFIHRYNVPSFEIAGIFL
jgi:hypothetical protein